MMQYHVKHRTPNTEHRTPNTEHRTPNTEHRTPNTEHRTPNTEHRTPNTEHRNWQTYALSLSNNAIRHVFTLFLLIPSTFWFKSSLKSLAKIALLALPLLSYSWQLQAANGNNNQVKRSDAIIMPSQVITHARPNLFWGHWWRTLGMDFRGPADIWNMYKGFLVQSIDPQSYNLNFPTTGMDGLYFDLVIKGLDESELIWEPVTHEGITATVEYVRANEYWVRYGMSSESEDVPDDEEVYVTRVRLKGPEAKFQWNSTNPTQIGVPKLPQTFELVGRDYLGNEIVKYGFVLQKWFVVREARNSIRQSVWCNGIGYRLPQVKDLTNAICDAKNQHYCRNLVGATPSSTGNHYQRRIGGDLPQSGAG
jgi:hypothetical protein